MITIPNTHTHHSSHSPLSPVYMPMPQKTVGAIVGSEVGSTVGSELGCGVGNGLGRNVGTQVSSVTSQQGVPIAVSVVIWKPVVTELERACNSVGTSAQIRWFDLKPRRWCCIEWCVLVVLAVLAGPAVLAGLVGLVGWCGCDNQGSGWCLFSGVMSYWLT